MPPGTVTSLAREPLVWFLVVGAALFGLDTWMQAGESTLEPADALVARIDPDDLQQVLSQAESMAGRPLSSQQRIELLGSMADNAVLLSEARRLGLDDDPQIRIRLIEKMRFILSPPPAVQEAELRRFHTSHPERYTTPATVDIESLSFAEPGRVPAGLAAELGKQGRQPTDGGEHGLRGEVSEGLSAPELRVTLGKELVRVLDGLQEGQWSGPHATHKGVVFVKVLRRRPAQLRTFEEVRDIVQLDLEQQLQEQAQRAALQALRGRYRVLLGNQELPPVPLEVPGTPAAELAVPGASR